MQRLAEEEKDRGRDATRCGMHNAEKKSERERESKRGRTWRITCSTISLVGFIL